MLKLNTGNKFGSIRSISFGETLMNVFLSFTVHFVYVDKQKKLCLITVLLLHSMQIKTGSLAIIKQ